MAMSQDDHDLSARPGRPLSTGEFRATPDASASTAQFQAFAASGGEVKRPWEMRTRGRNVARLTAIVIAAAVVIAIIAIFIVTH